MKKTLTTLALVLVIIALAAVMASCAEDKPVQTTAAPVSTTTHAASTTTTAAVTTTPASNDLVIANTEDCFYTVIYPKDAQSNVSNAAAGFAKSVLDATGKRLTDKNDSKEAEELEILVGDTNRSESAEAAKDLALNEYRIVVIGKKIAINAGCTNALVKAVSILKETYFDGKEGSITVPADLLIEGAIDMKDVTSLTQGRWNKETYTASNGVKLLYQIYLPKGYSPDEEYPCILYMHSAGVVNTDGSHIYAGEAEFLNVLKSNKYKDKAIIIAPTCPPGSKWIPANAWNEVTYDFKTTAPARHMVATLELLAHYQTELSIDDNRLYTYGMSMGGFAVWDLLARNPGKFAAAIPVAGAGDPTTAETMGDTAIWIFHGKLDDVVPVESAYAMKEALKEAGRTDIKYTEFPNLMHGIWGDTAHTEGLIDWMFEQTLAD